MDNKESSLSAALSAAEEDRSEAKNMISQMSTSCAPSKKRPFDALDGNDTAGNTNRDTNKPPLSIEALLNDMQHKMNHMQTEIDIVKRNNVDLKAENVDLKSKYYELESKVGDITSLKGEYEGSYGDISNIYDMQTEIDTLREENKELKNKVNDLEDQNEELDGKYDGLEIDLKDLTLKIEYNEWSYTAEDVPAAYWLSRGFEEEYAERMVEFLEKMKEYTHQLRQGEPPDSINLSSDDYLLHDDILLPHWKEFTDALKRYHRFEYRGDNIYVEIDNIQLQQEVINMLAPALQTAKLKKLILGRNIGSDALSFAEGIIQSNPHLKRFGWRNNQIESVDDMKQLCESIERREKVLIGLRLTQTFDGNSSTMMQIILDAASHQLKKLHLKNNGIGTVGTNLIANFLTSNPPLEVLSLENNVLNNDHAILLANSLQSNTNLQRIDLDDNNDITAVGRRVLLESVFTVSSLNACAASNHTCQIHGLTPGISDANLYGHRCYNKPWKIFTMLSATDDGFFNMNYLGDVSYKLIPNVLKLAKQFTVATPKLSEFYFEQTGQRSADWSRLNSRTVPITSVFELLRGWAVPSLSA